MNAQPNVVQIHADPLEAPIDRMGAELLRALVDEVRTVPAQWSKLDERQQASVIARLREVVRNETIKAMQLIAKGRVEAAPVRIESLTVKDGAKCVLQIGQTSAHDVLDYVGQAAVLVMCNPEQLFKNLDEVKADKDQPELPLEGEQPSAEGEGDPIAETEAEERAETERMESEAPLVGGV